jgi:DNA-binding NtrC family response regulator
MDNKKHHSNGAVLVVEADRVLVDLLQLSLTRTGFLVRATGNPADIPVLMEEIHPQVILLDLFMPGWNGLEVLDEMKQMGFLAESRVIVITSFGFREVLQQAILQGAVDFVVKPFDIDVLLDKVNKYLFW